MFAKDSPQRSSSDSTESFYKITKDLVKSHKMYNAFMLELNKENHIH